jgi:hypothetical protein
VPDGINPPISFTPTAYLIRNVVKLFSGGYVLPVAIGPDPDHLSGTLLGLNSTGTQVWVRPLPAVPFSQPVVDLDDHIYISTFGSSGDFGVYCIDSSHNVAWYYPVSPKIVSSVCPAYDNLLVFMLAEGESNATLTAIGTDTP